MFTGIIECTGYVEKIEKSGTNTIFWISSPLSNALKTDQSVSHNGVCLTIEAVKDNLHRVTAIEETLQKTNLNHLQPGDMVNIERCMVMNGRIDGHLVQGHVDCTATCTAVQNLNGSWEYSFQFPSAHATLVIEKGSICVNGISLTCFNVTENSFKVAIIPYTYEHTNMSTVTINTEVNLEFDVIGKYILRMETLKKLS
ncbi:MAG: riboflavin synthase [Hydrotalea flava]|uniref:riboflavin synthase n=1 Tax=Hydrotalea TaxID=1004300 RepID=UPI000942FAA4|nr:MULTISPECIES: riboflavin synthase [Hydrotalea]MBY0348345.1 riboflavin synthase [Hydrotalea flava]NIM36626.1 riboflavin synthase [Hydrotalea flava]NIM39486.1 riboflavin synthase [Hydrotalea flava]NIN04675.1 riboflavin synthase [Hydrotalea flava]NIN16347.1 riboflavin synthase [Hydrotalea flava]